MTWQFPTPHVLLLSKLEVVVDAARRENIGIIGALSLSPTLVNGPPCYLLHRRHDSNDSSRDWRWAHCARSILSRNVTDALTRIWRYLNSPSQITINACNLKNWRREHRRRGHPRRRFGLPRLMMQTDPGVQHRGCFSPSLLLDQQLGLLYDWRYP